MFNFKPKQSTCTDSSFSVNLKRILTELELSLNLYPVFHEI